MSPNWFVRFKKIDFQGGVKFLIMRFGLFQIVHDHGVVISEIFKLIVQKFIYSVNRDIDN